MGILMTWLFTQWTALTMLVVGRLMPRSPSRIGIAMAENADFYSCPVNEAYRSKMNIVFRLPSEDLEKKFVAEALE